MVARHRWPRLVWARAVLRAAPTQLTSPIYPARLGAARPSPAGSDIERRTRSLTRGPGQLRQVSPAEAGSERATGAKAACCTGLCPPSRRFALEKSRWKVCERIQGRSSRVANALTMRAREQMSRGRFRIDEKSMRTTTAGYFSLFLFGREIIATVSLGCHNAQPVWRSGSA